MNWLSNGFLADNCIGGFFQIACEVVDKIKLLFYQEIIGCFNLPGRVNSFLKLQRRLLCHHPNFFLTSFNLFTAFLPGAINSAG
jgi:hypothetical protein